MRKRMALLGVAAMLTALPMTGCSVLNLGEGETVRTGRYEEKGNLFYYDEDGNKLTGIQNIDGKIYYFGEAVSEDAETEEKEMSGAAQTGWITDGDKTYYFYEDDTDGVMYTALTGWYKEGKKTYYFDEQGVMQTGMVEVDGKKYLLNKKGTLTKGVKKVKNTWYLFAKDGSISRKLKKREIEDFETLEKAKEIVAEITNDKMTEEEKIRACFEWVMAKQYKMYRKFNVEENWIVLYANDHFEREGGDCHADGSAFAYLAKALGYKNVYICLDCDGVEAMGHCWTEIDGIVYDPLFAEAKGDEGYYKVEYDDYILRPVLKVEPAKIGK